MGKGSGFLQVLIHGDTLKLGFAPHDRIITLSFVTFLFFLEKSLFCNRRVWHIPYDLQIIISKFLNNITYIYFFHLHVFLNNNF